MPGRPKKRARLAAQAKERLANLEPGKPEDMIRPDVETACPHCGRRVAPHELRQAGKPDPTKKGKPVGGLKRTNVEIMKRRKAVEALLVEGFVSSDIVPALEKKVGKLYPWETLQRDIRFIRGKWEEEDSLLRPLLRGRQRRELYEMARSLKENRPKVWLRLQELIARIDGTESPAKVEIQEVDEFSGWSTEELDRYAETGRVPARMFGQSSRQGTGDDGEKGTIH